MNLFTGGKKGGKGSAGPKKGGAPNVGKDSAMPGGGGSREGGVDGGAASPTQDEIMAEEMAKKAVKDKIRQEYIGALTMEGKAGLFCYSAQNASFSYVENCIIIL